MQSINSTTASIPSISPHARPYPTPIPVPPIALSNGTLTATGVISLSVNHGALAVKAGSFNNCETKSFHKTAGIERVVMLGFDGYITLEALRWIDGIGAELLYITPSADTILHQAGKSNLKHPDLLRKQAQGWQSAEVATYLLGVKLAGGALTLSELGGRTEADKVLEIASQLNEHPSPAQRMLLEAQAASVYWNCLKDMTIRFPIRESVPGYWRTLGTRSSALTGSPRRAINPANAMLNYAFAVGESACVTALLAVGLNPQLGWLHSDQPSRNSAALDLLECIRPDIERWLIKWWKVRTFSKREFFEASDGMVRLMPSVTREIANTWPIWSKAVAPHAETIAAILSDTKATPTPLTERNRSVGRGKSYKPPTIVTAFTRSVSNPQHRNHGRVSDFAGYVEPQLTPVMPLAKSAARNTCKPSLTRTKLNNPNR